jgi:hypothetical protein
MMTVKNYQDLIGWQKAMDLVEVVYHLTKRFQDVTLVKMTGYHTAPETEGAIFRATKPAT